MERVERPNSSSIRKGNLYRIVKVGEWVGNVQTLSQIYEGLLMIMTAAVLYSVYCLCNGRSRLQAYVGPPQFSVFQNIHSAPDPRSLLFVGYRCLYFVRWNGWGVKCACHFHSVPSVILCAAIPPRPPHTSFCNIIQSKLSNSKLYSFNSWIITSFYGPFTIIYRWA